jgi:ABC-type Fe3+ transport system permease subunit
VAIVIALVTLSLAIALMSAAVAAAVLVGLPADYLRRHPDRRERRSALRSFARNAVGGVLVAIGALLAIPGVPGQGLLLVLAGLTLLDFRGKRRLAAKLLARPSLMRAVNGLRRRFSQPPLEPG